MEDFESYHPNPEVRRSRSKMRKGMGGKGPHKPEHDPVKRTEVEKHDDGTAHVVAHHQSGKAVVHEHPNEAAAHEHGKALMAGEMHGSEMHTPGQEDAIGALGGGEPEEENHEASTEGEDGGENESCPNCGAEMEDGKCPTCGHKNEQEDEEY